MMKSEYWAGGVTRLSDPVDMCRTYGVPCD
jgi:hypothetical protein